MSAPAIDIPDHIREAATKVRSQRDIADIEIALTMYDAGWPPRDVAPVVFAAPGTIQEWRRQAGLPSNGTRGTNRTLPPEAYTEAGELYESGLTVRQVGDTLGYSYTEAYRRITAAGVVFRKPGLPTGRRPELEPGWMTVRDASARTDIVRAHLSELCTEGKVPGAKLIRWEGRPTWIIPENAIPFILANHRGVPGRRKIREENAEKRTSAQLGKSGETKDWLPAGPLASWVAASGLTSNVIANGEEAIARGLRRIMTGEQVTVALGWADEVLVRLGAHLHDVWADVDAAIAEGRQIRFENNVMPNRQEQAA